MRGGFIACFGADARILSTAAQHLRWHRGRMELHCGGGLEIAAFVDAAEGPHVEANAAAMRLVHGRSLEPIEELQRTGARFAAVECHDGTLRASRDPLGLAPLFYRIVDRAVWLASEVAPLVALAPAEPDLEALSARAAFVPLDTRTGWLGIHRVVPGETLEVSLANLATRSHRYWVPERLVGTFRGGYADAVAEFRRRFDAAVKRCLDAPSAILLSGGLDSGAVALSAHAAAHDRVHLVHVHYEPLPQTHEMQYASAIAENMRAPLNVIAGQLTPWDIGAELDTYGIPYNWLPYGMDVPALSHIASRGITVALDGHDGDGVLGVPGRGVWGSALSTGRWLRLIALSRREGARKALRGIAADLVPPSWHPKKYRRRSPMQEVARYFEGPLGARVLEDDIYQWTWPSRQWKARQLQPLLPRAVISFEHKELEAARYGIDLRHPFADRSLVEFLISLPCHIKSDPGRKKALLVDALGGALPRMMHQRPKSDYMAVVRNRADPLYCLDTIRESNVRLPHVAYSSLFGEGASSPRDVPIYVLVNLARVHEFARLAQRASHDAR